MEKRNNIEAKMHNCMLEKGVLILHTLRENSIECITI